MIRNAVRAWIVEDDKMLFIKKSLPDAGIYYVLPGGAQEPDETQSSLFNASAWKN